MKTIFGMKEQTEEDQIDVIMIVNVTEEELVLFGDGAKVLQDHLHHHQYNQLIVTHLHIILMNQKPG